ncbi:hypothetical protein DFJ73DRAFT_312206 [Zopfochytrium polystomum]|nr:hypothetical protein DFJ73DRAFT_312206 [Zopfochytrium polystomum]
MVPEEGSSTRSKERQSAGSSTVSKGTASLEPAPPPSKPPSTQSLHRINRLERKESDDLSRFDLPKSMKESETRLTASSRDSGLAANASELRSAPLASSSTRHSEQNMVTVPSAAPLRDLGDRSRSASVASSANSSSAARSRRRQSRNGSAVSQSSSRRHADDFLKTPSLRGSGAIAYSKVHASVDDGSGYDNYDSYSSFGQEDWRGYEGLERAESSLQLDQEAGIVKETTLPEQKSRTSLRGSSDSIQKDKSGGFTSVTSRHSSQTSIVAHAINLDSPEPANFDSYIPSLAENPSKTAERSLSVNSRKSGSFASSVASASKVSRASRSSFNDGSFGDVADLQPETTDEGANAKQSHDGLIVRGSIGLDGANNNSTDFDSAIQSATADGLRQDLEDSKAFPENDESGKSLQGRYSVSSHESSSYSPSSQRQTLSVPCRGRFDTVTLPVPASPIVPALEAQFLAAGPTASSSTSVYSRLSEVVGSAAKQEDPHRPKIVVSASASQPRANDDSGTDDDSQRSGSGVRTDKFVDGFAPASNRFQSPISAFSLSMPSLCMTAPSGRIQSTEEETLASSRKSKSVSLRAMEQKSDRRARDDQDALQRRQEWLPTHHTKQTTAPQVSVTSPPIGAENSQRSNCDNDRDLLSKGSESVCEYEDAFTSGGSSRSSSPSFRKSSTRSSSRDSIPSPDFAYDKYDDDFSDMYSSGRSSDADFESRTVGHDDGAPREEDPFPVVEEFPVIDARDGTPRIPRSASSHSVDDAPFLRRKSGFAAPPPSHHVSQILSAANPQHVDARPRGRLSRSSTAASHAASTAASSTSAREPSHTSRELPSKSAKPSARTRAVRVEPARDEARSDGGKPPWRPNSKRTGTGWEYRKPTPKKATPPASPVLAHRGLSRSRTVTEDLESRPPFSAPVARKLHQAEKLPVTEEHTRRRAGKLVFPFIPLSKRRTTVSGPLPRASMQSTGSVPPNRVPISPHDKSPLPHVIFIRDHVL